MGRIHRLGGSLDLLPNWHQPLGLHLVQVLTSRLSSGITWGKVVSLYAVAGALAVDCVRHGHPAMVHTIVDCMGEFVRKSLTVWLKKRGGWVSSSYVSPHLKQLLFNAII